MFNVGGQAVQNMRVTCDKKSSLCTNNFDLIKLATCPPFLYNFFTQLSHHRFLKFTSVGGGFYTLYTGPTITTINI